ncbi:MAG: four helix bundle protein [Bacteroidia bacterium]|nr:four helix bundle protein [Bacteroidia bacterium]
MELEDLEVYSLSMDLADKVYFIVEELGQYQRDTIGKQWIRAIDSVSLNLSEGFGRFSYRDSRNFSIMARGSLYESKSCLQKVFRRSMITEEVFETLLKEHNNLGIKLNNYITAQTKLMQNERRK